MEGPEYYFDNFQQRRDFFQHNFALRIGRERTDVKSSAILRNSCPVCGYLTLDCRDAFEICAICFWEDDGTDDFEMDDSRGPNHMTLGEGRKIFQNAKRELLAATSGDDTLIGSLKNKFINLDNSIKLRNGDKYDVLRLQNDIIDLLVVNKIYGLEKLFGMYRKFTEKELIEAYTTMIDYSGKATPEITKEIEKRGGLESFLKTMEANKANKMESNRVLNEIIRLNKEGFGYEDILKKIKSDLWTEPHLRAFIESRYYRHQLFLNDKSVDRNTVALSFLGFLIASFTGSIVWCFSIFFLKFVFYPVLVVIYFICYFIIRGFVRKSHNNWLVFLSSLLATVSSFVVGFVWLKKM